MQEYKQMYEMVPPNSNDAEKSVLGAMIQDDSAATMAFEMLNVEDFYSLIHRSIFKAAKELHISHVVIDLMTISNELEKEKESEKTGGPAYLLELVRFVPSTANVKNYIKIVLEKSNYRKLIKLSQRIQKDCFSESGTVQDVLEQTEKAVFNIAMNKNDSETLTPLNEVLMGTFDKIEELSTLKGKISGVPTGLYDLDRMLTGMHGGELVLVGARPAMGKTSMALGTALFASEKGKKVAVFSMEMPKSQIGMRFLCSHANINMQSIRNGTLSENEWVKLGDAVNDLSHSKIYIDDTPNLTPAELRSRCRRLMMNQGLDLIVVDYLGLMSSDKKCENRQLEVSEISRQLKAIALELKIPLMACAQLSRAPAARTDKRPMLSDLRDSGSIEQDADVVLFLHREGYYAAQSNEETDDTTGEIIVSKQRNGPVGTVNVRWEAEFARYSNLPGTKVAEYI